MPGFSCEHEAGITLRISSALNLLERLIEDTLVKGLSFDIEPLEPLGELKGFFRIVAHQEAQPVGCISNPSRCIEPGAKHEPEVPRHDLLTRKAGGFNQRPYSYPAAVGQQLESMPHQYPVLPLKRHHVSNGSERHEVEQMEREVGWKTKSRNQRLHELERDPRPAERV